MRIFPLFLVFIALVACESSTTNQEPRPVAAPQVPLGHWRATLNIGTEEAPHYLPFDIETTQNEDTTQELPRLIIRNGKEEIIVQEFSRTNAPNSFRAELPVFNSVLLFRLAGNAMDGKWHNYTKKDYTLPFRAVRGIDYRFEPIKAPLQPLADRWKVTFSPTDEEGAYPAIGKFDSDNQGRVTGTFLTETGDYRFLEGSFDGKNLQLSCFDGAHAFLFEATLQDGGQLMGTFYSGKHWQEPWTAVPDNDFQLADMETLTDLREGYETIEFAFPNFKGDTIYYDSTKFQGKVSIVDITGTWCPNCMDASRFLQELYEQHQDDGLEVVAIDYELINQLEVFQQNERKMRRDLGITYPVLFGGLANKESAAQTLPMLNHILSYPTLIFVGKDGKVRAIHTGFSGPGTGEEYTNYTKDTRALVQRLLRE